MAEIKLEKICKSYENPLGKPTNLIVDRLDLHIKDGEFIVLVGPSGCGKSTTLRMIAGLESISAGDLYIDNQRVNDVPAGDRDLAMVFQSYALYPHMSVRENIQFGLTVRKVAASEINARTQEVAKMLGLSELLDRKPKQLSGGQRQRVAMARAIVRRPKAFLFDEPLSNLDAKLRMEVRADIARLRRQLNITTVYVTHDQVEAMTLADRVVVLNGGIAQQIGTPLEVYHKPQNKFVATFLGTPTMNMIESPAAGSPLLQAAEKQQKAMKDVLSVGIRPHDLTAFPQKVPAQNNELYIGEMVIDIVERLGAENFVYGNLEKASQDTRISAKLLDAHVQRIGVGDRVFLYAAQDRMHFFDANGVRL